MQRLALNNMNSAMQTRVKCLIVDDLEDNILALTALLRSDDVEVLPARSGTQALELLLVHDFALALLDVQMPDMDGFELAEIMRGNERTRSVPIIFVTAAPRDHYRLFKGYESGAVDFLYKPIESHILRNKADVFFQLARHKQQLALELRERTETLRLNEIFTAALGHDLRNPLSTIVMGAHVLNAHSDAKVRDMATRMLANGKRMTRMIEDMLDFARARQGGGIVLKRESVDLGALIARLVPELQATFPERRIDVRQDGDLAGDWDAVRLAQVVSNLISNALQHGDGGEPVELYLEGTHGAVLLAVSNAGSIPAEVLPHVFSPFRGRRREPGRDEGLGLGLYIVQQIVHAHAGTVEVDTNVPQRTRFLVRIPRGGNVQAGQLHGAVR